MQRRSALLVAIILCAIAAGAAYVAYDHLTPVELTVYTPIDSSCETIIQLSKQYGDEHNTAANITSIRGRKALLKEIIKNEGKGGVVILEVEYPLFNLFGMKTLKKKGFVEEYQYLYTRRALMVVRRGEGIESIEDLDGKRVAVVDIEQYHVPGACLAPGIVEDAGLNVTEINTSSVEGSLDTVVAGSADATIIWEGQFRKCTNSSSDEIETIELPQYGMDNAIAILNKSENMEEGERYVRYLLAHKAMFLPE